MTDYELFEKMTKAREAYEKNSGMTYDLQKRNRRLIEQCENVENKFYCCIMNTELHKILNLICVKYGKGSCAIKQC